MEVLAIMTALLSSSGYAHQVDFSQPEFLNMTGGDHAAAQQLAGYCAVAGMNIADCKDSLQAKET